MAHVRITVDLPDALLRKLKARAALEGTTLKQLVLTWVERGLQGRVAPASARSKKSALPALDLTHPLAIRSFSNARLFALLDDRAAQRAK